MSDFWRRIIAFSDPQLTADFQALCGVRSVKKQKENGTIKSSDSVQNDKKCCEEYRQAHKSNGDAHLVQNGSVQYQNGSASIDVSTKKTHEYKNGTVSHRIVQNGHTTFSNQQNGSACPCKHDGFESPQTNGFIKNGNLAEIIHSDDKSDQSKAEQNFVIQSKLLYYIFCFGANLGNEIFYIVFFSFGLWTFDCCISRKISLIWCVIMYIGQAAKDVICWPRPSSPPAIPLEGRYELEFGMPSTHAMVGVAIPLSMLYYTYGVYEYNLLLGVMCALIWCVVVSFSRLYLGMHSVLDIGAGIVGAFIILLGCFPTVDMLDCLMLNHPWCVPGLNIIGIGLCLAYPELKIWSTARGDTTQVMAVFSGIYQGLWYLTRVTTPELAAAYLVSAPTGWAAVAAAVARQLFGMVILVVFLEYLKKAVIYVASSILGLDPKDPVSKQHLGVELPYKYIGYYIPSFCAAYVLPLCYQYLGWHRGNFLNEVLTHSHHFGL